MSYQGKNDLVYEKYRNQEINRVFVRQVQMGMFSSTNEDEMISICNGCGNIKDQFGSWHYFDEFIPKHIEFSIMHSTCPDCANNFFWNSNF